jgi:pimeloyl-ACP methyl ester carboxylesterase
MLLAALAACNGSAPGGETPTTVAPKLAPAPCDRTLTPPGREVTCGDVRVPVRAGAAHELTVRVAIIHAAAPAADPVLLIAGGAGASAVAYALYYAGWVPDPPVARLLEHRDVIAVDLRGTGASQPALLCPDVAVRPLPEGAADSDDFPGAAVRACRERLVAEGVALDAFGSAAAAEDLELVRRALGVARWNVLGIGHGGRVALELVRRHAATVRSLIIDGAPPPAADPIGEQGPALAAALGAVFAACEHEPACDAAYPRLREGLDQVFATLEAAPVEVPTHGGVVRVTGRGFVEAMAGLLRDRESVRQLPLRVHQARGGDLGYVAAALGAPRGQASMGAHLGVVCAEQMPATSAAAIEARAAALPAAVRGALASRFYPLACPVWAVPAAAASLREPVRADVPTLLLAGEMDAVAPPAWAAMLASTLPRARTLVVRGQGHEVALGACGAAAAAAFIDAPEGASSIGATVDAPEATCASAEPSYAP